MPSRDAYKRLQFYWQLCLSLLLIALLVYNPFLALMGHSDGLTFQALARHRATVGASELDRFTPVQGDNAQLEAIVEQIFVRLTVEKKEFPTRILQDPKLPQPVELIASVWFRPPPAAKS
ncbi:MAG: hypothetical protein WAM58_24225 [Candidatus Acidiferrum sp.]